MLVLVRIATSDVMPSSVAALKHLALLQQSRGNGHAALCPLRGAFVWPAFDSEAYLGDWLPSFAREGLANFCSRRSCVQVARGL